MYFHVSETTGHQRLITACVVGGVVAMLPLQLPLPIQGLLAWCLGALTYLVLAWLLAMKFDAVRTHDHALAQDQPSAVLFALMVLSAFASVAAIVLMRQHLSDLSATQRLAHMALSMVSLVTSWFLIQTVFAFRYANRYYRVDAQGKTHHEGLEFPGKQAPDYFDFLYYSHVVGMTSQVSDVVVTTRQMRRLTLVHSVTSFAFNMLLLALGVNLMASAIQ
ncbi:MAG: DUF1345 domain-containing protein [Gammaproteobacteria bacterium]|jgi:uncharacterized membrane protein|nr:DUF1345 domain-containing protein [Gammaproteobacteria bacterium]MBU0787877.1 DUF1345 domain-containing protein [Gammaproteobacteria bacterium]MBU0817005.1 DUF1345 domain-containing protein [Gammaproteobacteria bacterium]MBU1787169.1 DUF1345 domain-containing protein [Gammaproteobacteria bacterium]